MNGDQQFFFYGSFEICVIVLIPELDVDLYMYMAICKKPSLVGLLAVAN